MVGLTIGVCWPPRSDPPVLGGKQLIGNRQAEGADVGMALQLNVLLEQLDEKRRLLPLFPAQIDQRDAQFEDLFEFDEADLGEFAGCGIRIGSPEVRLPEFGRKLHYNE